MRFSLKSILVIKRFNANHFFSKVTVLSISSSKLTRVLDVVQHAVVEWVRKMVFNLPESIKKFNCKGFGVSGCNNNNVRRRCAPGLLCENTICVLNRSN